MGILLQQRSSGFEVGFGCYFLHCSTKHKSIQLPSYFIMTKPQAFLSNMSVRLGTVSHMSRKSLKALMYLPKVNVSTMVSCEGTSHGCCCALCSLNQVFLIFLPAMIHFKKRIFPLQREIYAVLTHRKDLFLPT